MKGFCLLWGNYFLPSHTDQLFHMNPQILYYSLFQIHLTKQMNKLKKKSQTNNKLSLLSFKMKPGFAELDFSGILHLFIV